MSTAAKPTVSTFKSEREPIWCPGCGDYGALNAFYQTLVSLEIEPHNIALVSGIGCSSRFPYFVNAYCFHGVHGRALPTATGLKVANPNLTVCVIGGDGDGFSIGAGHLPHTVRRNPDITYLMLDNEIYGLTKGQAAPTSPRGSMTPSSPLGTLESPVNPVAMILSFGATFVARGYSGDPKALREIYIKAIQHPGFAFVDVLSPCPTFNDDMTYQTLRPQVKSLPEDHDPQNLSKAFSLALDSTPYTGIFYQTESVPFEKRIADLRAKQIEYGGKGDMAKLIQSFR